MTRKCHWISSRGCVYNINYHIVYSTKYRRKALEGEVAERLKEIHEEIAKEYGFLLREQGVMPDYVHLFLTAHPKWAPTVIVKLFKGISARKIYLEFPQIRGKLWNSSYYISTEGEKTRKTIEKYIRLQKVKKHDNINQSQALSNRHREGDT